MPRPHSSSTGDLRQALLDLTDLWSGNLSHDAAIPHEDQGRPELDPERSPQRPARAVLDLEVADLRIAFQQLAEPGCKGLAMPAPARAELQEDRPFHPVDLVADGLPIGFFARLHGHGSSRK